MDLKEKLYMSFHVKMPWPPRMCMGFRNDSTTAPIPIRDPTGLLPTLRPGNLYIVMTSSGQSQLPVQRMDPLNIARIVGCSFFDYCRGELRTASEVQIVGQQGSPYIWHPRSLIVLLLPWPPAAHQPISGLHCQGQGKTSTSS